MKKPASVAVLPFPLTKAALFGYGILRFLGQINEQTHTRFTRILGPYHTLFECEGRIVYLNCKEMYMKILDTVETDRHIKKILSFTMFGEFSTSGRALHSRLASALTRLDTSTSRQALNDAYIFISKFWDRVWHSPNEFEALVKALELMEVKPPNLPRPSGDVLLSLPVFKREKQIEPDQNVTGSFEEVLQENRIYELQDKHIGLAIGGPIGSGKSTLAVSLVDEMRRRIRQTKSHSDYCNLQVTVGLSSLDWATPTAQAIVEKWDSKKLQERKQPWTTELMERVQQAFLCSRAQHNVVIGDLPGKITEEVTKPLAASADASILISNDWNVLKEEWVPFKHSLGLPIVSRIRSRGMEAGFSSLVTNYVKGKTLNGRITAINRNQKSWDPFIQWLAPALLYDILPIQFEAGS